MIPIVKGANVAAEQGALALLGLLGTAQSEACTARLNELKEVRDQAEAALRKANEQAAANGKLSAELNAREQELAREAEAVNAARAANDAKQLVLQAEAAQLAQASAAHDIAAAALARAQKEHAENRAALRAMIEGAIQP